MKNEQQRNEELELERSYSAQAEHDQIILDDGEGPESYLEHVEIRRNWANYLAANARERAEYYSE